MYCVCSPYFGNSVCFNTERDLYQWLAAMMLAQVRHSFSPAILISFLMCFVVASNNNIINIIIIIVVVVVVVVVINMNKIAS